MPHDAPVCKDREAANFHFEWTHRLFYIVKDLIRLQEWRRNDRNYFFWMEWHLFVAACVRWRAGWNTLFLVASIWNKDFTFDLEWLFLIHSRAFEMVTQGIRVIPARSIYCRHKLRNNPDRRSVGTVNRSKFTLMYQREQRSQQRFRGPKRCEIPSTPSLWHNLLGSTAEENKSCIFNTECDRRHK